ncbi:exodeoxyribonuclease VII small subunit [Clostridium sp. MSJ-4]|uniref:Exodeoxyribonuclease 7 small subunit n=1 Tax=Clostridium simiarum TaxID=2841506 RepID=A0ABS6EXL9_9CLOT|nr:MULTISPECIES: exodeoxyribonuclease VII small subunit [Clostridium]MBU5590748.1 exodeoxyribonuclease VII small subunit [Clostridium simiarum]
MPKKSESYENLLNKLEIIVEEMEGEELTLEKSMKNYEEGIKLCNKLYALINEMEGKISILKNDKLEEFEQ